MANLFREVQVIRNSVVILAIQQKHRNGEGVQMVLALYVTHGNFQNQVIFSGLHYSKLLRKRKQQGNLDLASTTPSIDHNSATRMLAVASSATFSNLQLKAGPSTQLVGSNQLTLPKRNLASNVYTNPFYSYQSQSLRSFDTSTAIHGHIASQSVFNESQSLIFPNSILTSSSSKHLYASDLNSITSKPAMNTSQTYLFPDLSSNTKPSDSSIVISPNNKEAASSSMNNFLSQHSIAEGAAQFYNDETYSYKSINSKNDIKQIVLQNNGRLSLKNILNN
jgi:hypothetical protein